MKIMRIPLNAEGASKLYNQVKCSYKLHNMRIFIYECSILLSIFDELKKDGIKSGGECVDITITKTGGVLMYALSGVGVATLGIAELILDLIIKLKED